MVVSMKNDRVVALATLWDTVDEQHGSTASVEAFAGDFLNCNDQVAFAICPRQAAADLDTALESVYTAYAGNEKALRELDALKEHLNGEEQ